MSDNIPFDIQIEIIKKVSDVKSLIRFRSVSKPWKSFIENSDFIKGYGARHTQPRSCILIHNSIYSSDEDKYICLLDDDKETFKVQEKEFAPFVVSPLLKQDLSLAAVGESHGLLCMYGCKRSCMNKKMLVVWNPSIGKSFGIVIPIDYHFVGFGVCPVTRDPTVVKLKRRIGMPWHVEVFTLSSRVWNVIPSSKFPRESIRFMQSQVAIDKFIYWAAYEKTGEFKVVLFDLITEEFKVIDPPDSLTRESHKLFSVSKLRGSLVVYGSVAEGAERCDVWMMEHHFSFRKLFTIDAHVVDILGFSKSGELICQIRKADEWFTTLDVYDPCSQQIKNLGIYEGAGDSFFMGSYKESLLLLNHLDSHVYYDNN